MNGTDNSAIIAGVVAFTAIGAIEGLRFLCNFWSTQKKSAREDKDIERQISEPNLRTQNPQSNPNFQYRSTTPTIVIVNNYIQRNNGDSYGRDRVG
ncbi:hypothetical protein K440DRAFT_21474 [Wilcoxina mikolae CBS 423.85]|nr:hypothetical protein K440DRAFT_21474 [Wilcoxina mikolae CBS 423.85]